MAETALETERLWLKPPADDDLPFILEHMNTLAVMRYLGGKPRPPSVVADGLTSDIAAFESGEYRRWTVWLRDANCRIGRCGLFTMRTEAAPDPLHGEMEIGWTFAEPFWNRGYASEAAREVLRFAFETLRLPQIYSQTSDSNVASTQMMARLGFSLRPELGYEDPDYPAADNPTTVWSLSSKEWAEHG